jgi:uncharacterized membrane protein YhiD involved in acid resistance
MSPSLPWNIAAIKVYKLLLVHFVLRKHETWFPRSTQEHRMLMLTANNMTRKKDSRKLKEATES